MEIPMNEAVAYLKALTPEGQAALGGSLLEIPRFPFRVGRESRKAGKPMEGGTSHRRPDSVPSNDLYLADGDAELNVYREHFQIERREGGYEVTDRGSTCGTLVEGVVIGGHHRLGRKALAAGDVIIVGTSTSRYVFKFLVAELAGPAS
jgi:pSer/pThr/pTyr-binding forkhead associated (FHA) protein